MSESSIEGIVKLWVEFYKYYELSDDTGESGRTRENCCLPRHDAVSPNGIMRQLLIPLDSTPADIIAAFRAKFKIKDPDLVYKLRNHRGSLVLINSSLLQNQKNVPYRLEVTREHQNFKAQQRQHEAVTSQQALQKTVEDIQERISGLEDAVPNLKEKQDEKIAQELKEIGQTLDFVTERLNISEQPKWQGMFKKNPLW